MSLASDDRSLAPSRPRSSERLRALEALDRIERELEGEWSKLRAEGYGFSGLCAGLSASDLSHGERKRLLCAADEAQIAFLSRLDEFLRLLHSHFMRQVVRELDHAMKTMDAFYGRRRIRSIFRRYGRLKRLAERTHELEPLYGTAADHRRISVYQRFYAGVVAFSNRIRGLDPTMPQSPPPSLVDRFYGIRRGLVWLARQLPNMIRLTIAGFRILAAVLSKKTPSSGTPFTRQVDELFRALGEIQGYEVHLTGESRIPRSSPPEVVNLFAPTHRHGVTDNITFSHLRLGDYLVFNAVDQLPVLPRSLKDRVATTNGLIPVGKGRGPSVDRALQVLRSGISRNILIYPEGTVSEGFRGTRPPRPNFGEGLVRRIREAGYELNLVPVTYPDNARFLDLPPLSDTPADRQRRVIVSRPLDAAMIDALLEAGGGAAINRMVRLAWLEQLPTDDRHFLGQDRIREVERRLDLELDGIRYWGSVEPAPVSDVLLTGSSEPLEVREEPFRGKRVRVFRFPSNAQGEDGKILLDNLRAEASPELLIGIRPPAHIYLNVGPRRFDGDVFRKLSVKDRDYVYPGILIRFMEVPIKSLNAIRRKLEEFSGREQRTLTCASSACQLIARAANIKIDDHADLRPFLPSHVLPTRTIRKIIERGVRNHSDGQVQYQVYKTDSRSLEEILAEFRKAEIQIARDHLRMITADVYRTLRTRCGELHRRFAEHIRRSGS